MPFDLSPNSVCLFKDVISTEAAEAAAAIAHVNDSDSFVGIKTDG